FGTLAVSISRTSHPSFRPPIISGLAMTTRLFQSRERATPHLDYNWGRSRRLRLCGFNLANEPTLIPTLNTSSIHMNPKLFQSRERATPHLEVELLLDSIRQIERFNLANEPPLI